MSANTQKCLRLSTVKRIVRTPPYSEFLTEGALRAWIFDSADRQGASGRVIEGNGLAGAIIRVGRKVLLDLDQLDTWLLSHNKSTSKAKIAPPSSRNHKSGGGVHATEEK